MTGRLQLTSFYVIGSAAVFASLPMSTDAVLTRTQDVDVAFGPSGDIAAEELATRLDWLIGEGSDFDIEYGVHGQGVSLDTATFVPARWTERCIPVEVEGYRGLCMDLHDLALSKYGAGREKDLEFTRVLAALDAVDYATLMARLPDVRCDRDIMALIKARIARDYNR
jgi:predicted nucleotidyltransferase